MKVSFDREVKALYIRFKETAVTTKHLDDGIALDDNESHEVVGVEMLYLSKRSSNLNLSALEFETV